jgi:hypothetical protein
MANATFEDHPTDPDKVILRKPRYEEDDDIQEYKKPWVGLTDEEIKQEESKEELGHGFIQGVLWAEAKLKEKNT